ncbi:MAG: hypothetical protein N3D18_15380 [Roseococcus sp.]|nr:hypothetical protein [Roseococcus sp.]
MNPISPIRALPVIAARPAAPAAVEASPAEVAPPPPNPTLRIEPALGMVVLEVRDAAGEVVRSVPSERELEAYRAAALRGDRPQG